MIGKSTLKAYGFKDMQEYYDMIVDSKINGQIEQCREQFNSCNKEQKKEFLSYLADETERENNGNTVYYQLLKLLIEEI